MRICSTCTHSQVGAIEALWEAQVPVEMIALRFGLKRSSVHRHLQNHVPAERRVRYRAEIEAAAKAYFQTSEEPARMFSEFLRTMVRAGRAMRAKTAKHSARVRHRTASQIDHRFRCG